MDWLLPILAAIYIAGLVVLTGQHLSIEKVKYGLELGILFFAIDTIKILFFVIIWPIVAFVVGCKQVWIEE